MRKSEHLGDPEEPAGVREEAGLWFAQNDRDEDLSAGEGHRGEQAKGEAVKEEEALKGEEKDHRN